DPRQVHLHEILGRQIPRPELVLDVGDGGFDHLKTIAMVIVRDGGKNERQNREEKQPRSLMGSSCGRVYLVSGEDLSNCASQCSLVLSASRLHWRNACKPRPIRRT